MERGSLPDSLLPRGSPPTATAKQQGALKRESKHGFRGSPDGRSQFSLILSFLHLPRTPQAAATCQTSRRMLGCMGPRRPCFPPGDSQPDAPEGRESCAHSQGGERVCARSTEDRPMARTRNRVMATFVVSSQRRVWEGREGSRRAAQPPSGSCAAQALAGTKGSRVGPGRLCSGSRSPEG